MRIHKVYLAVGLLLAFCLFFELAAHADKTNEQTTITFSAPVQIPGKVLPAGTYVFQQAGPDNDPNTVQIFNADHSLLYAIVQTISTERTDVTGQTAVMLAQPEVGGPEFLVSWFYPGSSIGHEFVYPKQQEQELAHATQQTFVGNQLAQSAEAAGE